MAIAIQLCHIDGVKWQHLF